MNQISLSSKVKHPDFIKEIKGKKVGVVLSSGFFGFWAHAGFNQALEDHGVSPKAYSGASAGAILAAFGASGLRSHVIQERFKDLNVNMFWDPELPPVTIKFLLEGLRGYTGHLKGRKFRRLIKNALPVKKFKDCPAGLYIVATDLTDNSRYVFKQGDIAKAVHASGAVPFLFRSVKIKDKYFVDGGMVDKAPVKALVENEKLDCILVHYIASRSLIREPNWFMEKRFTPWYIYNHSFNILRHEDFKQQVRLAKEKGIDVYVVSPKLPKLGPFKMEKGKKAYNVAYKNTLKVFKKKKFLSDKELGI